MTLFLANRSNLQLRRLHDRIKRRLRAEFEAVRRRRARPSEPGSYRVVGEADPRIFLGRESYPATDARVEVAVRLRTDDPHEHYWFNWIEPDRTFLLGWHRDDDHPELGPVHVQVNQAGTAVDHESAQLVDEHPLAIVEARLKQLPDVLDRVVWDDGGVVGIDL